MDLKAGETYHSIKKLFSIFHLNGHNSKTRVSKKKVKKKKKDLIYRILKHVIGKRTFRWHIKNGN